MMSMQQECSVLQSAEPTEHGEHLQQAIVHAEGYCQQPDERR